MQGVLISICGSPVLITFMSFSAVSGWIDFIRRVVFFNSCHVSLGRSSVFSSLQNVWNNKTAELPLILLFLFSLIISETDVKLYWYTSTVTGYEELAVSFGSSLSSTPQNSPEGTKFEHYLHRWYWQKIENVIVRALTVTKLCKKSRSFVQNFLGPAETQLFSAALCPKARTPLFLKKYCYAGKITVYKGRNITSVMSRKLRKRDKKKMAPLHLGSSLEHV